MNARSHYSNFDDAWGLVGRMLRSGESSALWALGLAALGIAVSPLDRLLGLREERLLARAGDDTGPIVLIVGAPRSGTTLAYQLLASQLDVSIATNVTGLFPRAPLTGTGWFGAAPGRLSFRSYYGNSAGLRAPNDGFSIWNRWLGHDRYRTPVEIDEQTERDMRRFFSAWNGRFKKPFLNKNNRNADCVALLAKALPKACFVEVHRDPVVVVASLLKARQTVQGDASRAWGLRANDAAVSGGDPVESAARQLRLVTSRLEQARNELPGNRYMRIAYEQMCADPAGFAANVAQHFHGITLRPTPRSEQAGAFAVSAEHGFSPEQVERINAIVRSDPW